MAPAAALAAVGSALEAAEAEALAGTHLALDDACGAGARDCLEEGLAPGCPACPPPDVAPPVVGAPPRFCVPLPSGPALPRVAPPPFSEVLAWRIAWRTG